MRGLKCVASTNIIDKSKEDVIFIFEQHKLLRFCPIFLMHMYTNMLKLRRRNALKMATPSPHAVKSLGSMVKGRQLTSIHGTVTFSRVSLVAPHPPTARAPSYLSVLTRVPVPAIVAFAGRTQVCATYPRVGRGRVRTADDACHVVGSACCRGALATAKTVPQPATVGTHLAVAHQCTEPG